MITKYLLLFFLFGYTVVYTSQPLPSTASYSFFKYIYDNNSIHYPIKRLVLIMTMVGSAVLLKKVFCTHSNSIKPPTPPMLLVENNSDANDVLPNVKNLYGTDVCTTYDRYGNPILHKQKDICIASKN